MTRLLHSLIPYCIVLLFTTNSSATREVCNFIICIIKDFISYYLCHSLWFSWLQYVLCLLRLRFWHVCQKNWFSFPLLHLYFFVSSLMMTVMSVHWLGEVIWLIKQKMWNSVFNRVHLCRKGKKLLSDPFIFHNVVCRLWARERKGFVGWTGS